MYLTKEIKMKVKCKFEFGGVCSIDVPLDYFNTGLDDVLRDIIAWHEKYLEERNIDNDEFNNEFLLSEKGIRFEIYADVEE